MGFAGAFAPGKEDFSLPGFEAQARRMIDSWMIEPPTPSPTSPAADTPADDSSEHQESPTSNTASPIQEVHLDSGSFKYMRMRLRHMRKPGSRSRRVPPRYVVRGLTSAEYHREVLRATRQEVDDGSFQVSFNVDHTPRRIIFMVHPACL